ncbi:LPD1 domain-containing protein [Rhodanobacter lindaniclasticus]
MPKGAVERTRKAAATMASDQLAAAERAAMAPPAPAPTEAAAPAEPEADTTASIPFMITQQMRTDLRALGHTDAEIAGMTPEQANAALQAGPVATETAAPTGPQETTHDERVPEPAPAAPAGTGAAPARAADEQPAAGGEPQPTAGGGVAAQPAPDSATAVAGERPAANANEALNPPSKEAPADAETPASAAPAPGPGGNLAAVAGEGGAAAAGATAAAATAPSTETETEVKAPVARAPKAPKGSSATPANHVHAAIQRIAEGEHPEKVLAQADEATVRAVGAAMGKRFSTKAPLSAMVERIGETAASDRRRLAADALVKLGRQKAAEAPPLNPAPSPAPRSTQSVAARKAESLRVKTPSGEVNGRSHVDHLIAEGYTHLASTRAGDKLVHSLAKADGTSERIHARQLAYAQEAVARAESARGQAGTVAPKDTTNGSEGGSSARVQQLAEHEEAVPQSKGSKLPAVRRARDQDSSSVGEQLPPVPGGHGAEAQPQALDRQDQQRRGLRADELPVGDAATAGGEQAVVPPTEGKRSDAGGQRSSATSRRTVQHAGRATEEGRPSRDGDATGTATGAQGLEIPDAARRKAERARVGQAAGDQDQNAQGAAAQGQPSGARAEGVQEESHSNLDARVEAAAAEAATSPQNDLPEPTEAQKQAGVYKKGHVWVQGLDISIENPRGSTRSGVGENGKPWSHVMTDHYGYIRRTEGADGEQVDVYVGPNPASDHVYVVDQLDQKTGDFDEHKAMIGFDSEAEAVKAYRGNFDPGWKVGPVHAMSMDEFKAWLKDGDTTRPAATEGRTGVPSRAEPATPAGQEAELQGKPTTTPETPPPGGVSASEATNDSANTKDAGQELWYNRRLRAGGGLRWGDIEDLNATLKVKEVVKSKVWPRPNYEQLVADGLRPEFAHLVKQVYDAVAVGPKVRGVPTDAQLRDYIDTVSKVRDAVFDFVRDDRKVGGALDAILARERRMRGDSGDFPNAPKTDYSMLNVVFPGEGSNRWRTNGEPNANNNKALLVGGNKLVSALQPGTGEFSKALHATKEGWPAKQSAWQKLYTIRERGGTFDVTRASRRIAANLPTREAAEAAARAHYEENKKTGEVMASEARAVEKAQRTGPEHRAPGEDISSDRLLETFGFKGVNFGNWMKGDNAAAVRERQLHLNHAYDAMMDLADITGLPPRAMSLDGKLGLAFGAQGKGTNAAHFVPGVNEINLTRRNGAGGIAHEWAHALDHYFAVQAGEKFSRSENPFLTELSRSEQKELGVRPEITQAFQKIVNAMEARPVSPEILAERDARGRESLNRAMDKALKPLRADLESVTGKEALDEFDALADRLRAGDLGEGSVETGGKVPSLIKPRQKVPETVSQTSGQMLHLLREHGVATAPGDFQLANLKEVDRIGRSFAYAAQITEQRKNKPPPTERTSYHNESLALESDAARKNRKPYWSSRWEMFARAFESYIIDRLATREQRNDYLSWPQHSEEHAKTMKAEGLSKGDRYPRGAERQRIDDAFDTLLGEIKTRPGDNGNVALFSRDHVTGSEPFYSALTRSMDTAKGAPKAGDAAAWKQWMDGAQRRGEFKQAEREWLGVDQWLAEQKGKVSREQLQQFVRDNQVQVQEVELGKSSNQLYDEQNNFSHRMHNKYGDGWMDKATSEELAHYNGLGRQAEGPNNTTKFASYQLPGGENYKELLLTLPPERAAGGASARMEQLQVDYFNAQESGDHAAAARILAESRRLSEENGGATIGDLEARTVTYQSSHFDQPNILAHVRFNERTDADGKKVLFLEEVQSDWHQAGRRHGYKTPESVKARQSEIDARMAAIRDSDLPADRREWQALRSERAALDVRGVPDAPFKKEWPMLAFKRMVRYAAENGFDRIAWTTGEQQAERYDLSKQIESITVAPRGGYRDVTVEHHAGSFPLKVDSHGIVEDGKSDLIGKPLDEVIGKEMADRIMAVEGRHTFSGDGLKLGGEGMQAFYDRMLPNEVNKWAKQFGAKVGQTRLAGSDTYEQLKAAAESTGLSQSELDAMPLDERAALVKSKVQPVHSLDVTPAMREAALGGVPMFRQSNADIADTQVTQAPKAHTARIERLATAAMGKWKGDDVPRLRVVDTPEQLPASSRFDKDGNPSNAYQSAAGMYDGRTIWIVASKHTTDRAGIKKLLTTMAHEGVGHYGVDRIVERELGAGAWTKIEDAADRLRQNPDKASPAIRAVLAELDNRYAGADRTTYAREFMAVTAERGVKNGLLDRVITALRRWLRRALPDLRLSEHELRQLLVASDQYLRVGQTQQQRVQSRAALAFAQDLPDVQATSTKRHWPAGTRVAACSTSGRVAAVFRMIGLRDLPMRMPRGVLFKLATWQGRLAAFPDRAPDCPVAREAGRAGSDPALAHGSRQLRGADGHEGWWWPPHRGGDQARGA